MKEGFEGGKGKEEEGWKGECELRVGRDREESMDG